MGNKNQVLHNKKWREKNSEKFKAQQKNYHYFKKYGITQEDYDRLFRKQKGKCKICGVHQLELSTRLAVDHDHQTGKVRALLCSNCNTALGLIRDDVTTMRGMVRYIQFHNRRITQ